MTIELRWDITCGQRDWYHWVAWAVPEGLRFPCQPYAAAGETPEMAKANLNALLLMAVAPRGKA